MVRNVVRRLIRHEEDFERARQRTHDPSERGIAVQIDIENVQPAIRREMRIKDETEKPAVGTALHDRRDVEKRYRRLARIESENDSVLLGDVERMAAVMSGNDLNGSIETGRDRLENDVSRGRNG